MVQPPSSDAADTLFQYGAGAPVIRKRLHVVRDPSLVSQYGELFSKRRIRGLMGFLTDFGAAGPIPERLE